MRHFATFSKLLGIFYSLSVFQVHGQINNIQDVNNEYSTSAPPNRTIPYIFTSTNNLDGCQYKWEPTNNSNLPNQTVVTAVAALPLVWGNINGNASVKVTTQECNISGSNGTTATYTVPIRYLGQVGAITSNVGNTLACSSQTVTFSAGAATNADTYQWNYSNLTGWNYVSGQGTTTLTMVSSTNTGGNVSVTAKRSNAPDVSTSSSYNISRATLPTSLVITGPAAFCPGDRAFYGVNGPQGTVYNWSVPSGVQIFDGAGTSQIGVNAQSVGGGTISVEAANGCGTASSSVMVVVGPTVGGTYTNGLTSYQVQGSNGMSLSNSNQTCYINLNSPYDPNTTYSWQITNQSSSGASLSTFSNGKSANITCSGGKQLSATCTVNTRCGSSQVSFSCYNTSGGFRMAAYPNPANQEITIATVKSENQSKSQSEDESMAADKPVEDGDLIDIDATVRLLNKNNTIVREGKLLDGKLNFNLAKVANGIYYLQISFGDKQIRKQIIIQH